jgi:hypothetical protein
VAVLAASVELGRKGSGEGGNAVRWSGGGGKQQQVVLACWFREEEEMERRGWVGQGKWATRKGNETESDEEKKQWPVREKSTARLMRGIQTRFKWFCFSFSFFRVETFEYCLNWIRNDLKVYKFWGFTFYQSVCE